jgi:hypothetical protein
MTRNDDMSDFDRDAWIRKHAPNLADRAFALRDRANATGLQCYLSLEECDDEYTGEVCITVYDGPNIFGCSTLDHEALSFYMNGLSSSDATDDEFIAALTKKDV